MDNNRLFFVNVCRRLVCGVYFVIVPLATLHLIEYDFLVLQYTHISM